MPHAHNFSHPFRRAMMRFVLANCAALGLAGCSDATSPALPTDVFDPLLHQDAATTELPPWQTEDVKTASDATSVDGAVACPEAASKADGSCCPDGLYWDAPSGKCLPAGPSGCFTTGAEDPANCVPRWCFVYLDESDKPCAPGPENCRAVTAPCPINAAAINIGCPAGLAPELNCAPAGNVVLPGGKVVWPDGAAMPGLSALMLLTGTPALPAPIATPLWCNNGAGAIIDATVNPSLCVSTACAIGQRPDPAQPTQCQDVAGPAWTCPPGFVVASDACAPDPADCSDPWGGVAPGVNVVFVSAAAAVGGSGSQAAPFQSLTDAIAALPTGGTIAIGAGIYNANLSLFQPIALRGACAKDVILQGAPGNATVLIAQSSGSQISNLTVSGGRYGIRVEGAVQATVDHVYVHSAVMGGLYALDGAAATVKNAFIHTTLSGDNKTHGRGIALETATLDISNARVSLSREVGLYASDSTVTAKALVIDGTLTQESDNKSGFGLYAVGTSTVTATDLRVTGNRGYGVRLEGAVPTSGSNWWIDGTLPGGDQKDGIGLAAFSASVKLTDLRVTNSRTRGIWIVDNGGTLSGHNVRVSDTQPQALDSAGGQGVVIEGNGASGQFSGLHVHASHTQGVSAAGLGAALGLDFAVIDATAPRSSDKTAGTGLEIVDGAKLLLPDSGSVTIAGSFTAGFLLSGGSWQGGSIRVQDTQSSQADGHGGQGAVIESNATVSDATLRVSNSQDNGIVIASKTTNVKNTVLEANLTLPRTSDGTGGGGILIAEGASVQGRVTAIGNRDFGLTLDGAGSALDAKTTGSDAGVVIGFTQMNSNSHGGNGIQVVGGAKLSATGVRVQNSYGHGIFVYDPGSALDAKHVQVSQTQVNASPAWGRGISVSHGAKATLADVQIESSHDVGLFIADTDTTATIDDLSIDGGTRGAAIQNRALVAGHRWRLQNHTEVGLMASGAQTRLNVRDLAVHATGYGVEVHNDATARLARVAVVGAQGLGLLVDGAASHLDVFDARVSDVTANVIGLGDGLVAQSGGTLRIAGLMAHDWSGTGILSHAGALNIGGASLHDATGTGIRVVNTDLKLSGSRTQAVSGVALSQSGGSASVTECAFLNTTAGSLGSSDGLEITANSLATLVRTLVSGMTGGGIVLAGADVTGDGIRVSGNGEGLVREGAVIDAWIRSLFFGNSGGNIVDPGNLAPVGLPATVTALGSSDSP